MRVTLDTNVIISALLFGGKPEQVTQYILASDAHLVLSGYIIEEIARILRTKFGLDPDLLQFLTQLLAASQLQTFDPWLNVVADSADNRVLETAVTGRADFIVTGDKLLLQVENYQDIAIITPAQFLEKVSRR